MSDSIFERKQQLARIQYLSSRNSYIEEIESINEEEDFQRYMTILGSADTAAIRYPEASHFVFTGRDKVEGSWCPPVFTSPAVLIDGSNLLARVNSYYLSQATGQNAHVGTIVKLTNTHVGRNSEFHKIRILNGELADTEAFIQAKYIRRLSQTKRLLPVTNNTCRITSTLEGTVCDATTSQWVNLIKPYLYAPRCEYWITVRTRDSGAGGSEQELEARKNHAISLGIDALFEYYDKVRDEDFKNIFKHDAYEFARATAWHIDPPPGGGLKVLVTVPAKYFDAIPKRTRNLHTFLEEKIPNHFTTVRFNTSEMQENINLINFYLLEFHQDAKWRDVEGMYKGPLGYGDFSFAYEAERLSEFIPFLANFLRTNGFNFRRQNNDFIEIGFDMDHKISYVMIDQGLGNIPLTVGFNFFRENAPCSMTRTMVLLENYDFLVEVIRSKRNQVSAEDFIQDFIMPTPDKVANLASSDKGPCKPDPLRPLKCCDFDLWSSDGIKDHFGKIGKNTKAQIKNLLDPEKLKKDFLNYQEGFVLASCPGKNTPINLFTTIDNPRAPSGIHTVTALIDAAKQVHDKGYIDFKPPEAYRSKYSPLKKASFKLLEDADIKLMSPGLSQCLKTDYEFINEPVISDIIKRLAGKGAFGANGQFFSAEDYQSPTWEDMGKIWNAINVRGIMKKALECTCSVLEAQGDRAQQQLREVEDLIEQANLTGAPPPAQSPEEWWHSTRPTIDSLKNNESTEKLPAGARAGRYVRAHTASPPGRNTTLANREVTIPTPPGIKAAADAMGVSISDKMSFEYTPSGVILDQGDDAYLPPAAAVASELAIGGAVAGLDSMFGPGAGAQGAAFAHEAICKDLCKALPLLCSCIDLSLPNIDIPRFTIEGIFGYLVGLLIDILIDILLNIILGLIQKLLDDLLRCEFDKSDPQVQEEFNQLLNNATNFDIFGDPASAEAISSGINSDPMNMDLLRPYMDDVPLVVSPKEFCQLIRGEADPRTLNTLEDLLQSQHTALTAYLRDQTQIQQLFIIVGRRLSDTTICDQLVDLSNSIHNTPIADHICEGAPIDELKERLRAGDSSSDQIAELLRGVRLCRQQRLLAVSDVARQLSENPQDFLKKLIPPIMGAPGEDSLIPRDPPELRSMVDKTVDTIFLPVAMAFDRDATSFPESLIETEYKYSSPSDLDGILAGNTSLDVSSAVEDRENNMFTPDLSMAGFSNMIKNLVDSDSDSPLQLGNLTAPGGPLSQIKMSTPTGKKIIGSGLQDDLRTPENFKFSAADIKGKTATAFTLEMAPFKSFAYDTIDLQFNEGDNILDYIPGAGDTPTNEHESGQSPLARAMGMEPIVGKIKMTYSLPLSSFCVEWDKQRDFYEVQLDSEVVSVAGPTVSGYEQDFLNVLSGPVLNIAGEKKIKPEILNMDVVKNYEPKGFASLQQEIFAHFMMKTWQREFAGVGVDVSNLTADTSPLYDYYLRDNFNVLTQEFLQSMAAAVGNSKYFSYGALRNLALKGDKACVPPKDSLVNIDTITAHVRDRYYSDQIISDHKERFGMAVFEGVVNTFIRVYMLEFILSGIFPFSRFNSQDVMDEPILKLAVKHLRDGLTREGSFPLSGRIHGFKEIRKFLQNAGVHERLLIKNVSSWKATFYEEFLRWCEISILRRIEAEENFFDKFLGQQVIVTLDPIMNQERISVKFQDVDDMLPHSRYYFALRNWYNVYWAYKQNLDILRDSNGELPADFVDDRERRDNFDPRLTENHESLHALEVELNWWPDKDYTQGPALEIERYPERLQTLDALREQIFKGLEEIIATAASDLRSPDWTPQSINEISERMYRDGLDPESLIPHTPQFMIDPPTFFTWYDEVSRSYDCECIVVSDEEASGQFSSWERDPETNKIKMGYLEFMAREQLYTVRHEVESYIGSEIEDINSLFLGNINPRFRNINPIARDPVNKYFVKQVVDIPSLLKEEQNLSSAPRLPEEIFDGTALPFILERYIKVTDYGSVFWNDLKSANIQDFFGPDTNYTSDQMYQLWEKMAPGNRFLTYPNPSRSNPQDPESIYLDLNPEKKQDNTYFKESIVPIEQWFEWLASLGFQDENGNKVNPMWQVNSETGKAIFNYEHMFENMEFGLRLMMVDKQYQKSVYSEESIVEILSDVSTYEEAIDIIKDRDTQNEGTFSLLEELSDEAKGIISRKNKAFLLTESTYSTFNASASGVPFAHQVASVRYPESEIAFLSVPVVEKLQKIDINQLSTSIQGGEDLEYAWFTAPEFPKLSIHTDSMSAGGELLQWRSYEPTYVGDTKVGVTHSGNLDDLYAIIFGIDREYAAGKQIIPASSVCGDMTEILRKITDAGYWENLSYFVSLRRYNDMTNSFSEDNDSAILAIQALDRGIREIEDKIQQYFISRFPWVEKDLWILPQDGGEYPFGSSRIFRADLVRSPEFEGAFGPEGFRHFSDASFLSTVLAVINTSAGLKTFWNTPIQVVVDTTRTKKTRTVPGTCDTNNPATFNHRQLSFPVAQCMEDYWESSNVYETQTTAPCWESWTTRLKTIFKRYLPEKSTSWVESIAGPGSFTKTITVQTGRTTPMLVGTEGWLNSLPDIDTEIPVDEDFHSTWTDNMAPAWALIRRCPVDQAGDPKAIRPDVVRRFIHRGNRIEHHSGNRVLFEPGGCYEEYYHQAIFTETRTVFDSDAYEEFRLTLNQKINDAIERINMRYERKMRRALISINNLQKNYRSSSSSFDFPNLPADAIDLFNGRNGERGYKHRLIEDLISSHNYSLLTDYIFPLKRFASLFSIYSTSKISGLTLYRNVFADTKLHAKQLFIAMASSFVSDENGRPGWWRVDIPEMMKNGAFDPLPWWMKLLQTDLSFNLLAFITYVPKKLLQIILSVPWFAAIVDPLCSVLSGWPWTGKWTTCKDLLGRLPPNRKSDDDDEENLPRRLGDGYGCGTREQIKEREARAAGRKARTSVPNSFSGGADNDFPFGG
tara:strand:+ start:2692 stop:11586 length:8895 start_codon:yes stop_codon:yes gene_type:complete